MVGSWLEHLYCLDRQFHFSATFVEDDVDFDFDPDLRDYGYGGSSDLAAVLPSYLPWYYCFRESCDVCIENFALGTSFSHSIWSAVYRH